MTDLPGPTEVTAGAVDAPAWRSLDPRSVTVGRFGGAAWVIALAFGAGMTVLTLLLSRRLSWVGALLLIAGAAALVAGAAALAWIVPERHYRYTRYRLDEHGLVIHRGRLFHSELAVLRSRIQHTDVSQGPFQRLFGLGTVVIYTAGSAHAAIPLAGLSFTDARRLRAELTGVMTDDVV